MVKELTRLGRILSGNILSIGFRTDSEFIKKLYENKKITQIYTLLNKKENSKFKKKKLFGNRTINIKKLKKVFKKKKIDYTFIELSSVDKFLYSVVKNSIDITNKNIYILLDNKRIDEEVLMKRYSRYGCKCSIKNNILNIDCKNIKTNKFKNFIFFMRDLNYDLQEIIAFILIGA